MLWGAGGLQPPPRSPAGPFQVKELDAGQRLRLARLICALARCDGGPGGASRPQREAVARLLLDMGMETQRRDVDVAYALGQVYFDRDDELVRWRRGRVSWAHCDRQLPRPPSISQVTGGRHIQDYLEHLSSRDPVLKVGNDYVLAVRASLILRGIGRALGQHRSTARSWQGVAEAVMREAGEDPAAIFSAR